MMLNRLTRLPIWMHVALAGGALGAFQISKTRLDASYAASGHPVDYVTGQTGFDAAKIKEYYAHMQDAGTLDVYVTTQVIDFAFIASISALGLFLCTLVARLGRPDSWGRGIALLAGVSLIVGACCDALENTVSFVMLADPAGFADWLALPYSAFACVKFALIATGMLCLIASLLVSSLGRILGKQRLG